MTIDSTPPPPHPPTFAVPDVKQFVIQGKPIVVQISSSEISGLKSAPEEDIKSVLADKLAKVILQEKLCEFTKLNDIERYQIHYRARAFLVPNDQVRLLRENGYYEKNKV